MPLIPPAAVPPRTERFSRDAIDALQREAGTLEGRAQGLREEADRLIARAQELRHLVSLAKDGLLYRREHR